MAKMTIKMSDPKGFSDVQLVEKVVALQKAARTLKLYRVRLSEELDIRQGKRLQHIGGKLDNPSGRDMGSNPVTVKMKPAIIKGSAHG